MPLDTPPLRFKSRNLAFKLETTTGTAISLSASDGTVNVYNPSLKADIEIVERQSQGSSVSPIRQDTGARGATCEFECDMAGDTAAAAPPPAWTDALKACGMTLTSTTFTPVSGATDTLTMGLYQGGRQKSMAGSMGTFTLNLRRGQPGRFKWQFRGVWQPSATVTQIAPTYDTFIAPRVGATTFTIGGTTYRVPEVEIEKGNVVMLREDIAALDSGSSATGYRSAYITSWMTKIRVSPEALGFGTKNWNTDFFANTTAAFSCIVGATAGSIFTISAPKVQLINPPDDEDREGLLADKLEFLCLRSADAGDDDLSIACT